MGIYDPYITYGTDPFPTFSPSATAEALFPPACSYGLIYNPAPLVPAMDSSAEVALDALAPTSQVAPSDLGYFDEDLFDRALRSAARETEVVAGGISVGEEVPAEGGPALVPELTPIQALSPLPTSRDITASPTSASTPRPTLVSQEESLKRKRIWGKYEEGEDWFVASQRKLIRRAQQHQEFKEMREGKVRQVAEIVGGEITASLAEARAKAEEQTRLVAELRSLLMEQRRLVEELRRMVGEKKKTSSPFLVVVDSV